MQQVMNVPVIERGSGMPVKTECQNVDLDGPSTAFPGMDNFWLSFLGDTNSPG